MLVDLLSLSSVVLEGILSKVFNPPEVGEAFALKPPKHHIKHVPSLRLSRVSTIMFPFSSPASVDECSACGFASFTSALLLALGFVCHLPCQLDLMHLTIFSTISLQSPVIFAWLARRAR